MQLKQVLFHCTDLMIIILHNYYIGVMLIIYMCVNYRIYEEAAHDNVVIKFLFLHDRNVLNKFSQSKKCAKSLLFGSKSSQD